MGLTVNREMALKSTSFPGSTLLSRWRLREDPGTHRYTPREILHKSWSILSRDTQ